MLASCRLRSGLLHSDTLWAFRHSCLLLRLAKPVALHVLAFICTGAWVGWDLIALYTLPCCLLHGAVKLQSYPIDLISINTVEMHP